MVPEIQFFRWIAETELPLRLAMEDSESPAFTVWQEDFGFDLLPVEFA